MAKKDSQAFERGLYEVIVTDKLEADLQDLAPTLKEVRQSLREPEAGDRLAFHLSQVVRAAINGMDEKTRVNAGISLTRLLTKAIVDETGEISHLDELPVFEKTVLTAILGRNPDGATESLAQPLIPLLDTTLLTNSPGEPRVGSQLLTEIDSASRIDLVMAFIRFSGIRPFLKGLRKHCESGKHLRVLTTTYTNSTELSALNELRDLGAEIRVSYDTTGTRLHAKAWHFHRPGGMSTAYIGSSNLTFQAQRTGLEWNVRISGARNESVVEKVQAVFDAYWESGDFEKFDPDVFVARTCVEKSKIKTLLSPIAIRLYPFQERLIEQITVARDKCKHRNLLVSATGTGKTVMAAVDYARLRKQMQRSRLLFVAHTKEILEQSLATFRHALLDADFGELWVAGNYPHHWENVFASIQSLSRSGIDKFDSSHFDVVIIDEIHHGAAKSYARLLNHIQPKELLGLTATPERSDGLPILHWFGDEIASELRLWDAIDQSRLVPFDYFGIHDGSDLTEVKWKRGAGYDVEGLTNIYTANDAWAKLVLKQLLQRVQNVDEMRALGFCVGIDHAKFMARIFNEHGIKSAAIWGNSPKTEREEALKKLNKGIINILFSVDLFNEGVDVPNVETLLLLRPTDSPVLFLQQLGRGLRKAENKSACLVLDFVGQHRREFKYHRRLQALLGGSRRHVGNQVTTGFPFLPAGCHLELEPKAREIVLDSIRNAVPGNFRAKALELQQLVKEGVDSLDGFLKESGLELEDIYQSKSSWSDLCEQAGLDVLASGPNEDVLRRACGRLLHVDDATRLDEYIDILSQADVPRIMNHGVRRARVARMLVSALGSSLFKKNDSLQYGLDTVWQHPQIRAELIELFGVLRKRINHHHIPILARPRIPLQIHARYSRIEILSAFDPKNSAKVAAWQTGVRWLPEAKADLLAFTLDKTSGQFSPTTRYRDYAISPTLIHWESQGAVRAESKTGQRYKNHVSNGTSIYLFARETTRERAFWFLGPATYVKSEGEKPIAITWKLEVPLPGDLFSAFAAAVA